MHLQYKTKGFVYKKKDRGEADRIFTIFTYDFGKIDVFAKSIRKIDSKLKSGIEIFSLSALEFVEGKRKTLTDAVVINKFKDIIGNPEKLIIAKKIVKILDAFIHGQEHDKEIYNLITDTFEKLNHCAPGPKPLTLAFLYFIWNFFAVLGYAPELLTCTHCHNNLNENELFFSNKEGGVICKNCLPREALVKWGVKKVDSDAIKTLRIILKKDWETLVKLKISGNNLKTLKDISKNYYLYLLSSHTFTK